MWYPSKWCADSAIWWFNSWCHVKPMRKTWCKFCVHPSAMHQFTVSFHSKSHRYGCIVFSCHLLPTLLAEWLGSFTCYCSNTGVEWIPKWESARKVVPGDENSPTTQCPSSPTSWDLCLPQCYFGDNSALNKTNQAKQACIERCPAECLPQRTFSSITNLCWELSCWVLAAEKVQ